MRPQMRVCLHKIQNSVYISFNCGENKIICSCFDFLIYYIYFYEIFPCTDISGFLRLLTTPHFLDFWCSFSYLLISPNFWEICPISPRFSSQINIMIWFPFQEYGKWEYDAKLSILFLQSLTSLITLRTEVIYLVFTFLQKEYLFSNIFFILCQCCILYVV